MVSGIFNRLTVVISLVWEKVKLIQFDKVIKVLETDLLKGEMEVIVFICKSMVCITSNDFMMKVFFHYELRKREENK